MGVGAAEPEGAHRRQLVRGEAGQLAHRPQQPRDPGRGQGVADLPLDGADARAVGVQPPEHRSLHRIADGRARAVGLDEGHPVRRHPRPVQRAPDHRLLARGVGGHHPQGGAVVVDRHGAQDAQHGQVPLQGAGQGSEQHHPGPLPRHHAVGVRGERPAAAAGGQGSGGLEQAVGGGGQVQVDAAGQGQLALAGGQPLAGQLQGDQGGGAGGVHREGRPPQVQLVGHPGRDHVQQVAGQGARVQVRVVQAGEHLLQVRQLPRPHVDADLPGGRRPRPAQGLVRHRQQQPLLGVHHRGLAIVDTEAAGVEARDVIQEPSDPGVVGRRKATRRGRIQQAVPRPGDPPQLLHRVGAGEPARGRHDRDRLVPPRGDPGGRTPPEGAGPLQEARHRPDHPALQEDAVVGDQPQPLLQPGQDLLGHHGRTAQVGEGRLELVPVQGALQRLLPDPAYRRQGVAQAVVQLAPLQPAAQQGTLLLAAGGPGQTLDGHHVGRGHPRGRGHAPLHLPQDRRVLVAVHQRHGQRQLFAPRPPVRERGRPARANPVHGLGHRLHVVGVQVAATDADDVLVTPREGQHPVDHVAQVAGAHPAAVEQRGGGVCVPPVPGGHVGTAGLDVAHPSLGQHLPRVVDHPQLDPRQRAPHLHHLGAVHLARPHPAGHRRRDPHRRLGQAVQGVVDRLRQARQLAEPPAHVRGDGLGAVEHPPHRRQVQVGGEAPLQVAVEPGQGEVGGGQHRGPGLGRGPQPVPGIPQRGAGVHPDLAHAHPHRQQVAADQPHVVEVGHPGQLHVPVVHREHLGHLLHVGQQVLVGQHDPARCAGTPRRELDQRRVVTLDRGTQRLPRQHPPHIDQLQPREAEPPVHDHRAPQLGHHPADSAQLRLRRVPGSGEWHRGRARVQHPPE